MTDPTANNREDTMTNEDRESFTLDLNGYARCWGDGHATLEFKRLTHPVDYGDSTEATHWATCPTTGEPILMGWVDEPDARGDSVGTNGSGGDEMGTAP